MEAVCHKIDMYPQQPKHLIGMSQDGGTALIAAASGGHVEVIKALLDKGSNMEARRNVSCWFTCLFYVYIVAISANMVCLGCH